MPQISKTYIGLGNRSVGSAWVDGAAVRGDGGAARPQLIVPLTISLESRPADSMLAVVALRARLLTQPLPTPGTLVTEPVVVLLINGVPARSLPQGSNEHVVELSFSLAPLELAALETHRHSLSSDAFQLHLAIEPVVAALKTFNQLEAGRTSTPTSWEAGLGMFSEMLPFWSPKADPVVISIERSTWVREVLPGLGYDRMRLIEIEFPPPLPEHPSAAWEWDKARRAFDEQRYGDCVSECRDILSMWQRELGSTQERRVAEIVSERRGWKDGDRRRAFLDGVWKATTDLVNVPHHPEGESSEQPFDAADAQLALLLTASLSSYVRA